MSGFLDTLINWLHAVTNGMNIFFFGFMAGYLTAVGFLVFDRIQQQKKDSAPKLPLLGEDEKPGQPNEQ